MTAYSGTLLSHLFCSQRRVLCGFVMAAALGVLLGFATGLSELVRRILDPFVQMIRTVPGVGWLPVAMVWFGVGEGNTLFLISLAAFFPVYINVVHAVCDIPKQIVRAGKSMDVRGPALFCHVLFPAAFPQIAVGLRLALGVSWAYLVLGEITGVTMGLGAVMNDGRMLGHVDIMLAAMIVIALAGKINDLVLMALCRGYSPQMRARRKRR